MLHNSRTKVNGELAIRQLSTLAQIAYDDETVNVYGDDGIYDVDGVQGLTLEQLDKELSARVDIIGYSYYFQDEIECAILEFFNDTQDDPFQSDLYMYMVNGKPEFLTFVNVGGNSWKDDDHHTICSRRPGWSADDIDSYEVFCEFINREEMNRW